MSWWLWVVAIVIALVVLLSGLRWALADYALDHFGSWRDWLAQRSEAGDDADQARPSRT